MMSRIHVSHSPKAKREQRQKRALERAQARAGKTKNEKLAEEISSLKRKLKQ